MKEKEEPSNGESLGRKRGKTGENVAGATRQRDERTADPRRAKRPPLQQERIKNKGLTGAWNYVQVVVRSKLRVEARMKIGHSIWAKYREGSEVIDLDELFSNYWSSNHNKFTAMSQSSSPTTPRISSDRRTEPVVIGKHSGYLEVLFSVNDTVRTLGAAPLRRLISFA